MKARSVKRLKADLKLRVFTVFLVLSLLFWILIKLSKTYTTELVFDVKYTNIPAAKVFQSASTTTFTVSLKSSGFNLLKYKLKQNTIQVDINKVTYKSGSDYYYLPNNHLLGLQKQLTVDTEIKRVQLDTVFIKMGFNKLKKVPVRLNGDIQFKLGYNFVNQFFLVPDSVSVSGPSKLIDDIHEVNTVTFKKKEVSSNINEIIKLQTFANQNILISSTNITLSAAVDKFTEGTLKVPFKVVNLPEGVSISTFPKEISVVFKVGLSNYNKINSENLKVVCDFSQTEKHQIDYLIPTLKEQSSFISSVRFKPSKIEFLIEK
ncbi:MAG: hypothetical protein KAH07_08030 [Flavobacteriaceae bacterium]|nr:hypothetical protein [Flavobacteriaceae bacterium]